MANNAKLYDKTKRSLWEWKRKLGQLPNMRWLIVLPDIRILSNWLKASFGLVTCMLTFNGSSRIVNNGTICTQDQHPLYLCFYCEFITLSSINAKQFLNSKPDPPVGWSCWFDEATKETVLVAITKLLPTCVQRPKLQTSCLLKWKFTLKKQNWRRLGNGKQRAWSLAYLLIKLSDVFVVNEWDFFFKPFAVSL